MNTIKSVKEFLKKIKEPTNEINKSITKLELELEQLNKDLEKVSGNYSLEDVKKSEEIKRDIDLTKETITSLEKRKAEIIEKHSEQVLDKALELIDLNREHKRAKEIEERKEIYRLRARYNKLQEEMKQKDFKYYEEEQEFYNDILPYIAEKLNFEKYGTTGNISEKLRTKIGLDISGNTSYRSRVLKPYLETVQSEPDYAIAEDTKDKQ